MKDNKSTDIEAQLLRRLRTGLPPARDPLFRIAVLERREQRMFRRRLVAAVAAGAVATFMASLAPAALIEANADIITAWLTDDVERAVAALTIVATACFTLSAVWLVAAGNARGILRALRRWLWV